MHLRLDCAVFKACLDRPDFATDHYTYRPCQFVEDENADGGPKAKMNNYGTGLRSKVGRTCLLSSHETAANMPTSVTTQGAVKNWNDAAALLPGRTNKDCRKRWHKVRQDIRKGAWMPEEDEKLQQAVTQIGLKFVSTTPVAERSYEWLTNLLKVVYSIQDGADSKSGP